MSRRILVLVCLCVVLLAGCARVAPEPTPTATPEPTATPAPQSCAEQAAAFLVGGQALFDQWQDAAELARNTPRLALSPAIGRLQDVRREWRALAAPECATPAHAAMDKYMTGMIDGYLAFMADESMAALKLKLAESNLSMAQTEYLIASLEAPK